MHHERAQASKPQAGTVQLCQLPATRPSNVLGRTGKLGWMCHALGAAATCEAWRSPYQLQSSGAPPRCRAPCPGDPRNVISFHAFRRQPTASNRHPASTSPSSHDAANLSRPPTVLANRRPSRCSSRWRLGQGLRRLGHCLSPHEPFAGNPLPILRAWMSPPQAALCSDLRRRGGSTRFAGKGWACPLHARGL